LEHGFGHMIRVSPRPMQQAVEILEAQQSE
jgi:hypothetical protein